jgi:hypothetical protein
MCQAEHCSEHAAHLCGPIPPALIEAAAEVLRPHVAAVAISPRVASTSVDLGTVAIAVAYRPSTAVIAAAGVEILAGLVVADAASRLELSPGAALVRLDVVAHLAGSVAELMRELPVGAAAAAVRAIGAGVDLVVVSAPLDDRAADELVDWLKFSPPSGGIVRAGGSPTSFCRPRSGLSDREAER